MNGEDFRSKLREYHLNRRQDKSDIPQLVEIEEDKRMNNAQTVRLYLEDHTLGIIGNITRMGLLRHKDVTFSGLKLIHPLMHKVEIKLQTNGNIRPENAFLQTVQVLASEVNNIEEEWMRKVQAKEQNQMKEEI